MKITVAQPLPIEPPKVYHLELSEEEFAFVTCACDQLSLGRLEDSLMDKPGRRFIAEQLWESQKGNRSIYVEMMEQWPREE